MQEYTVIFIGKSGSGKGTQMMNLKQYLTGKGVTDIYQLQSGQGLRDMIENDTYTSKLLKDIPVHGKLIPTAIAIWSWVDAILKSFSGQKIFLVDGAPRKLNEAIVMNEMFDFYNRKNRYVITINVSDEWSKQRLKNRGRKDDLTDESIDSRLKWFHQNSPEILNFFEQTGGYKMFNINGEQNIEDVQKDIINALNL